jgi:2-amino-4-hydroxy-6-hydroxymethyldihydropteridine diphosphokinase
MMSGEGTLKQSFIGVGSNLNHPISQVQQAITALKNLAQTQFIQASSLYSSKPLDDSQQPDYINAVIEIKTSLDAMSLLRHLQNIEKHQGRVRDGERWGPRVIDLDILLYGNENVQMPELIIPHVGMKEREFVIIPLHEIAADLIFPSGESLKAIAAQIVDKNRHIQRLNE